MFLTTDQQDYERDILNTKSHNHMLMEYEDQTPLKRYVKVNVSQLSMWRLDMRKWKETGIKAKTDAFLSTTTSNGAYYQRGDQYGYSDIEFRYNDNVIELYTPEDVVYFERMNRKLIENSVLIEYDENVDYVYALIGYSDDSNQRPIWQLRELEKPIDRVFVPANVKRG